MTGDVQATELRMRGEKLPWTLGHTSAPSHQQTELRVVVASVQGVQNPVKTQCLSEIPALQMK